MKLLTYLSAILLLLISCSKQSDDEVLLISGTYEGTFQFRGETLDYRVIIDGSTYDELDLSASNGKEDQCLSYGTYSILNNKLNVELTAFDNSDVESCLKCKRLPGIYTILYHENDSIVFERGVDLTHIRYFLKMRVN